MNAFSFFVTSYEEIKKDKKIFYQMENQKDRKNYYLEFDKNASEIDAFFTLHANIKATRNKANHLGSFESDRDNITIYRTANALDKAINEYLETVERLRSSGIILMLKRSDNAIS